MEGWTRAPSSPAIGRQGGPGRGLSHAGRGRGLAERRRDAHLGRRLGERTSRQTHGRTDRRTARGSGRRLPGRSGSQAGMDSRPGETDRERKEGGGGGGGPGRERRGRERESREEGPGKPPGGGGRRKRAGTDSPPVTRKRPMRGPATFEPGGPDAAGDWGAEARGTRAPPHTPPRERAPHRGTPICPPAKMPFLIPPNPPTLLYPKSASPAIISNNSNISTNGELTHCQWLGRL